MKIRTKPADGPEDRMPFLHQYKPQPLCRLPPPHPPKKMTGHECKNYTLMLKRVHETGFRLKGAGLKP